MLQARTARHPKYYQTQFVFWEKKEKRTSACNASTQEGHSLINAPQKSGYPKSTSPKGGSDGEQVVEEEPASFISP